jgi:uncharacterized protein YpmB
VGVDGFKHYKYVVIVVIIVIIIIIIIIVVVVVVVVSNNHTTDTEGVNNAQMKGQIQTAMHFSV